jgi:hypothetical protein
MVVEDVRVRARRELEQAGISVESASFIVGDRPSGGWDALATKEDLVRFATKEDLVRFATKEDLERFATKEDLERFATKEDLERFATKEDLERFATKEDLAALRFELHQEIHQLTRWMATLVIGAMSVSIASSALIGAALRFA